MNDTVLIMMATYNGAKYIQQQIDSIVSQSYSNWKLVIRDDGSDDDTCEIIEEYQKRDNRITLINNTTSCHGAFLNFHELINECKEKMDFDYYMFSDQDDIWDTDKIERFIQYFRAHLVDQSVPTLCYADMALVDKDGKILSDSINALWKIDSKNRVSVFFSHKIFGCNLMINKALFKLVPNIDTNNDYIKIMSHDNYYAKFAAVFGKIIYMSDVTMQYRRHDNNSTVDQKYKTDMKRLLYRVTHIFDLASKHANVYNQSLITIGIMDKMILSNKERLFIKTVENRIRTGGIRTLSYLNSNHVVFGKRIENISRKIIITTRLYRKYIYY